MLTESGEARETEREGVLQNWLCVNMWQLAKQMNEIRSMQGGHMLSWLLSILLNISKLVSPE